MPVKAEKKAGKKAELSSSLRQDLKSLTNQYVIYESRLYGRNLIGIDEKRTKLEDFLKLNSDQFDAVLVGLRGFWKQKHGDNEAFNAETASKEAKLTEEQRFVLQQYLKIHDNGPIATSQGMAMSTTSMVLDIAGKDIKKKAKHGNTFLQSQAEDHMIDDDIKKRNREILRWLYKHAEIRTAAKEGTQSTGKKSQLELLEALAARPESERTKIFYLVCINHTHECTENDFVQALLKGPNIDDFKKNMNKAKWKFWWRITGDKMNWGRLSRAIFLVDGKLQHNEGYVGETTLIHARIEEERRQEEEKEEKEKANEWQILEKNENEVDEAAGKPQKKNKIKDQNQNAAEGENAAVENNDEAPAEDADPQVMKTVFDSKTDKRIKEIENKLRKLQRKGKDDKKAKEELENLSKELRGILKEHKTIIEGSVGIEDPTSWIIEMGKYAGDVSTILECAPVMEVAMGIAVAADMAAAVMKFRYLVKSKDTMNKREFGRQIAYIGHSALQIGKDVSKLVDLSVMVSNGMSVVNAGNALSGGAYSTMTNALGVITGAATTVKGAMQSRETVEIKAGAKSAKGRLDSRREKKMEGDDALYANDLTEYAGSIGKCRGAKAAYNTINGSLSTISSIFNLTGLGAIVGIPMTLLAYTAMGVGWLVKYFMGRHQKKNVLDNFFGVNEAIRVFKEKIAEYNQRIDESNTGKKEGKKQPRIKFGFFDELDFRAQLRSYGESLIGASSDAVAINFMQTRYAEYLWNKIFVRSDGGEKKYWEKRDWEGEGNNMSDDELIRFACRDLVTGMGTECKFSRDGNEKPKTTMEEIKRRLVLE